MNKIFLTFMLFTQFSFSQNEKTNIRMLNRHNTGFVLTSYHINDSVYVENIDLNKVVFKDVNVRVGFSPRGQFFRVLYDIPGDKDLVKVFKYNGDFYYQYYRYLDEMAVDHLTDVGAMVLTFSDLAEFYINNPVLGIYRKQIKISRGSGMGLNKQFSPDGNIIYVSGQYPGYQLSRGFLKIFAYNMLGEQVWMYNFDNFPEDVIFTKCSPKLSESGDYLLLNTETEPEKSWYGHKKVIMLNKDGEYLWHIDSLTVGNIQYDEIIDRIRFTGTWRSSKTNRDKIIDVKLSTGEIISRIQKPRNKK